MPRWWSRELQVALSNHSVDESSTMDTDSYGNVTAAQMIHDGDRRRALQPHWRTEMLQYDPINPAPLLSLLIPIFREYITDFRTLPPSCSKVIKTGLSLFVAADFHNPLFAYLLSVIISKQISNRISIKSSPFPLSSRHFSLSLPSLSIKEQFPSNYSFSIVLCHRSILLNSLPLFSSQLFNPIFLLIQSDSQPLPLSFALHFHFPPSLSYPPFFPSLCIVRCNTPTDFCCLWSKVQ